MQGSTGTPHSTASSAPTYTADRPATDAQRVVQQAYERFQRGDIPALLGMIAADCEWTLPAIEHVPFSGPRRGHAAVARFFEELMADQRPRRFEPQEFIAQGDQVVVLGHAIWDISSTGRSWEADFAHVFAVRDGKVASFREYTDTAAAAAAFRPTG